MSGLSIAWLTLVVDVVVKTTLLWMVAWILLKLLRIRDSNVQHRVWAGVLGGMLFLPLLAAALPSVQLPLPIGPNWWAGVENLGGGNDPQSLPDAPRTIAIAGSAPGPKIPLSTSDPLWNSGRSSSFLSDGTHFEATGKSPQMATTSSGSGATSGPGSEDHTDDRGEAARATSALQVIDADVSRGPRRSYVRNVLFGSMIAWTGIAALLLVRLAIGLVSVSQLIAKSSAIDWKTLRSGTENLPERLISRRVTVRESSHVLVPVTIGWLRPKVLLPAEWSQWSGEKLKAVLIHELTHVSRGDCAIAFIADLNRSLHWYHPLAWWLQRHLAELAEEACDDAAIVYTGNPTRYATHLLEVAASLTQHSGRVVCPGMPMAQRSNVETRISMILDFTRPPSKNLTWKAAILIALVSIPMIGLAAALRPTGAGSEGGRTAVAEPQKNDDGQRGKEDELPKGATAEEKEAEVVVQLLPHTAVAGSLADPDGEKAGADGDDAANSLVIAGTVLDPRGRPAAGAKVRVLRTKSAAGYRGPHNSQLLAECTTDDLGRFQSRLARNDVPVIDAEPSRFTTDWIDLIATKPGFGFAYGRSQGIDPSEEDMNRLTWTEHKERPNQSVLTLTSDDVPIHGRLIDIDGNAIVSAEITIRDVWTGEDGTLDAWQASANESDENFGLAVNRFIVARSALQLAVNHRTSGFPGSIFEPVTTDADGRFSIRGLGRERLAELIVRASGYETVPVYMRTEQGEVVTIRGSRGRAEQDEPVYAAEFSRVLGPSVPVIGEVTDRETGAGISRCRIEPHLLPNYFVNEDVRMEILSTQTDEAGRYRIEGLPLGRSGISVVPPTASAFLPSSFRVNLTPGMESATAGAQLVEGILVSGRVTDESTGAPVLGTTEYFAHANNPFLAKMGPLERQEVHTDANGRFTLAVLPGPGIVAFKANEWTNYPPGIGTDEIDAPRSDRGTSSIIAFETSPMPCFPKNYHALKAIDPEPAAKEETVSFSLAPGAIIRGSVTDPAGNVVSDYYIIGWQHVEGEQFEINNYLPNEGRRLTFFKSEGNLVGLLDLKGKQPDLVKIVLNSGGAITGKIVDADGIPMESLEFENSQTVFGNEAYGQLMTYVDKKPIKTDREGRFRFEGIIPGLKYSADVFAKRKLPDFPSPAMVRIGKAFSDMSVESGEVKDLGEIVIDESTN